MTGGGGPAVVVVGVVVAVTVLARSPSSAGSRARARVQGWGRADEPERGLPTRGRGTRRTAPSRRGRRVEAVTRLLGATWVAVRGSIAQDDLDHALVLETVARPLRAGTSLAAAVDEALTELPDSAAARELSRAMFAVRSGAPLVAALERWSTDRPTRGRALAGTALVLAAELGGAPGRPLEEAARGLRDRAALSREVRALSSQARASAAVMVLGPPAFLGVASTLDRRLAQVLLATPLGLGCLVAGVALDLAGAAWMAHLVGRVS